jgi:hypothetical protein
MALQSLFPNPDIVAAGAAAAVRSSSMQQKQDIKFLRV